MKRIVLLLVALGITMLFFVSLSPVFGQGGDSLLPPANSGLQAVNLNTEPASINATYYAEDGTQYVLQTQVLTTQGDNYTYFREPTQLETFGGAAILESEQSIAVLANAVFADNTAAAYNGVNQGSTRFLLPLIVVDNFGVTSTIGLQNTNLNASTVARVTFTEQGGGTFIKEYTLAPGSSRIVTLRFDDDFVDPDPGVIGNRGWVGSAVVEPVDGFTPLVASVFNHTPADAMYAYSGFAQTGDVYYLPLARSGFGGNVTGIQVVDANLANNGDTTLVVTYTGQIYNDSFVVIDNNYTCVVQATLPDNQSVTFYNRGDLPHSTLFGGDGTASIIGGECQSAGHTSFDDTGGTFLGSAIVSANPASGTAVQPASVAVVVNDQVLAGGSYGAYEGFLPSDAAEVIISPLVRNDFFDQTTGSQIQNISLTDPVTITAVYKTSPLSGNQKQPITRTVGIAPSQSVTLYLPFDWSTDEVNWLGSVTVSRVGGNGSIVGITNDAATAGSIDSSVFNMLPIR